ncbi:MAG: hypothetical protein WAM60_17010 [Candidatus Promineifilaceae bacterium]
MVFFLTSCSIIGRNGETGTPHPAGSAEPNSAIVNRPMVSTAAAPTIEIPTATVTSTPTPLPTETAVPTITPTPTLTPSWSNLHLTGKLLYMTIMEDQGVGLVSLDLLTGERKILFQPPQNGWLVNFAVSPENSEVALAYAPPSPDGEPQADKTSLYLLPLNDTESSDMLQPVLREDETINSGFFTPAWSPDGQFLYYTRNLHAEDASGLPFQYFVERVALPDGQPERILEDAVIPVVSPDGSKMAFLTFDPETFKNDLYLADVDGKNAIPAFSPDTFLAVDDHFFSPDGTTVVFSAVSDVQLQQPLSLLDRLLGVQRAEAHSLPSDWWQVSADGGQPERLTDVFITGLYGTFSPDGQYIGFLSTGGIFVMQSDGSGLTLLKGAAAFGGIAWIP